MKNSAGALYNFFSLHTHFYRKAAAAGVWGLRFICDQWVMLSVGQLGALLGNLGIWQGSLFLLLFKRLFTMMLSPFLCGHS